MFGAYLQLVCSWAEMQQGERVSGFHSGIDQATALCGGMICYIFLLWLRILMEPLLTMGL